MRPKGTTWGNGSLTQDGKEAYLTLSPRSLRHRAASQSQRSHRRTPKAEKVNSAARRAASGFLFCPRRSLVRG